MDFQFQIPDSPVMGCENKIVVFVRDNATRRLASLSLDYA